MWIRGFFGLEMNQQLSGSLSCRINYGQLTRYWYIIFIPVESTRILVHSSSTSKNGASRNQSLTFWTSVFVVIRMFLRCRSVSGFAISVRTGTSSPTPARRIVSPKWPFFSCRVHGQCGRLHKSLVFRTKLQKSRQLRPFKNIVCCQTNAQIWPSSCCRKSIRAGSLPLRRPEMC